MKSVSYLACVLMCGHPWFFTSLVQIGRQLSDQNISLTVVGFDFTEESELQVKADESQGAEQIKPQNEMMLRSMVDSLDGTYIDGVQFYQQMCALTKGEGDSGGGEEDSGCSDGRGTLALDADGDAAIHAEPAKPQVLKVPFEITPKLVVQAQYLSLISSLKKPTLKKYHPTNPSDRASTDRTYLDSRGEEVEFVERAKAYVYGKELVPVQEDDLEVMKLQEDSVSSAGRGSRATRSGTPLSSPPCAFPVGETCSGISQADLCPSAVHCAALALHEQQPGRGGAERLPRLCQCPGGLDRGTARREEGGHRAVRQPRAGPQHRQATH